MRRFPILFPKSSGRAENVQNGTIYEFSEFRLIPDEDLLLRRGEPVPLPPKAYATLVLLIERHGHLVKKAELIDKVWSDAFVEEAAVSKCVWTIRNALGEDSKNQQYIQTVPKRGYKFVADVIELKELRPDVTEMKVSNGNGHTVTERESLAYRLEPTREPRSVRGFLAPSRPGVTNGSIVAEKSKTGHGWKVAVGGITLIVLSSFLVLAAYLFYGSTSVADDGRKKLAVLPIQPITSKNRDEIYEIGIADHLIHAISSSCTCTVRPISSTRKYIDIGQDPVAAGRELRVDFVIASTYLVANGKIRVTSQLINVSSEQIEDTFQSRETDTADVFWMQRALAGEVASELVFHDRLAPGSPDFQWRFAKLVGTFMKGPFTTPWYTENEEAYRHYLKATNLSEERDLPNLRKALEHLEQAVSIDPKFADSWVWIAHLRRDILEQTDSGAREHYEKSMEAISRALAIDRTLPDAYSARCSNKYRYEYDFSGADADCKRALELEPTSPVAHRIYANLLYARGRFEEAAAEIQAAIDLEPISFRNQQVYGLGLYYARRYGESEDQFKRLLEENPDDGFAHSMLTKILEEQGKESEAFEYFIKGLELGKSDTKTIQHFKTIYSTSGWRSVTVERTQWMEMQSKPSSFQLACLYAKIGDKDKTFMYLEEAYRERSFFLETAQVEPQLDALRNDPRYAGFIKRLGLDGI